MNALCTTPIMDPDPINGPPVSRQAFAALAREHHRCLLIYARALVGNHATAADLAQDAFVAAWKNLGRFDVTRDFGAWLRGIVRNKWRDHLRRHRREVDVDDATLDEYADMYPGIWGSIIRPMLADRLGSATFIGISSICVE